MKVPILIPSIFDYPLTYENKKQETLKIGDFVKVPFGSKQVTGVVWNFEQETDKKMKIKKIIKKIDIPKININMIKFINWFSRYNIVPLGMSLKMCLLKRDVVEKKYNKEFEIFNLQKKISHLELNYEQKKSLNDLEGFGKKYCVSVLEGVTGSGKTLVYFERLKKIINKGFQALVMFPEIALTDQFDERFEDFFGFKPAIWHSRTSSKNKKIIWKGVIENKIKLIVGARSSLFLPFSKLGIIIVDEEHDASYKQDEGVVYNARDMAITRSSFENIPIHLITSIPSVETYNNIVNKKYNLTTLTKRYRKASLPDFKIVNLNYNILEKGTWISKKTIQNVNNHLDNGDQILFFLNRRGYAPFVTCKKCNQSYQCPNCTVNLIFHKYHDKLLCHHCGYKTSLKRKCNDNGNCDVLMCGPGIERIYTELKNIFPNKIVEIFSSDVLQKLKSPKEIIKKIENKKIDILIGTQLISKGYHFPKLNCIVVVDADFSSHGYDLRAAEKNIQLYHQLSGRAGREGDKSTIYFQTYTPDDEILLNISKNDTHGFLKKELTLRKEKKLPPFFRLISLIISGKNELLVDEFALKIKLKLPRLNRVDILGPVNAPIFKIKKSYRSRILIRYPHNIFIQKYLSPSLKKLKIPNGIKLGVDVDPIKFS